MSFEKLSIPLLDLCRRNKLTLVTAESCTGGLIAAALTDIAGSSDVVWGGFVSYADEAKTRLLDVPASLIEENGAVSEEVVHAMVVGALKNSTADLAVAVSGIAGPGGGSPEKPVGTVWIAAGLKNKSINAELCHFSGSRSQIRKETVNRALQLCEKAILS
ncbi:MULTISPECIES: CinA family protein [unclassified Oceanispirochaeta]|uniref:CinA family protein n=1 Tax=unclassified Oceanispirochaeta TaxID=2635722 RepID=UPI000E09B202|nr:MULTISPECIES: CinA family protein [unclassified Oceanispirochaeta]MBF9015768.1 CinA family protein [Oceanispirochaeta sp. M2]NPD72231.1 CinA family protein [Oceanispirochaeta sp. M1]RDG32328.1 CinA family protein [Oceanispirochaeta sp. M1]